MTIMKEIFTDNCLRNCGDVQITKQLALPKVDDAALSPPSDSDTWHYGFEKVPT